MCSDKLHKYTKIKKIPKKTLESIHGGESKRRSYKITLISANNVAELLSYLNIQRERRAIDFTYQIITEKPET